MIHPPGFSKSSLVISSIIIFVIILLCGLMSVMVITDPAIKYSQVMVKAAMAIRDVYPDTLDFKSSIASAREAMLDELDRFSGYMAKEQFAQFDEDLSGGYYGVGISVIPHDSGLLILEVREGSPAAMAGVLTGDIIIAADTINLSGKKPAEAVRLIKGKENTTLSAKIYRPTTDDTLHFEMVRKRIDFLHVPFAGFTADSALYIRLLDFNVGASDDVKSALDSLYQKNSKNVKGIILDLRDNPGGLIVEAQQTAQLFLNKGDFIVGTSSRSRWQEDSLVAEDGEGLANVPLAVLVNRGSASASEIVAGALRYSGHALLVGDTTFGKGLVQGFIKLPEGDALRLTISRYYFAGKRYLNNIDSVHGGTGEGLVPDIACNFVEKSPFYQQLEQSLVLFQFAHKFQDEIIAAPNDQAEKEQWIKRLAQFAFEHDFKYSSELTASAQALEENVDSGHLKALTQRAVQMAESLDHQLFEKQGDFLWMRLRQIAFERKYGAYRAYKEAIVPGYVPIERASKALSRKVIQ